LIGEEMIKKIYGLYLEKRHIHYIKKLKNMGMTIGKNCKIIEGVKFDESHCWLITIGNNVSIAPNVRILAHDGSTKRKFGYTKIGPVNIADNAGIGAEAIILLGVSIGEHSIIGAGSVVAKDVPPRVICSGNPAKVICSIDEFYKKKQKQISESPRFGKEYTIAGNINNEQKNEMKKALASGIGYVV
jgi:maltose O-acetyltransferase